MRAIVLFSILIFLTLSCSTLPRTMSGKVGCPQDEIEILDTNPGMGVVSTTWVVSCRGRKYSCSLGPDAKSTNDLNEMDCMAMDEVAPADEELNPSSKRFDGFIEGLNKKAKQDG